MDVKGDGSAEWTWNSNSTLQRYPAISPPPEPEPPEPLDHHGNIIGFRSWTLNGHRLASLTGYGSGWEMGPNRARCASALVDRKGRPRHKAPHPDCHCGLYAWHEVTDLPLQSSPLGDTTGSVFGAVRMWGEAEVYEYGLRAEWAEPVALSLHPFAPPEFRERLGAVASEFDVPVVPLEQLKAEAKRHGSSAKELAPERPRIKMNRDDFKMPGPGQFGGSPGLYGQAPHAVPTGGLLSVRLR